MNLTFDPVNHRYTLGRLVLPSVTQVLTAMRMGTPDYSGISQEVLDWAGKRGTEVHSMICALAQGGLKKRALRAVHKPLRAAVKGWKGEMIQKHQEAAHGHVNNYVRAAQKFIAETGFVALQSEVALHHPSHRYAGTVDCTGKFHDKSKVTVDWKTGELTSSCALQLVAYNALLYHAEMFHYRRVAVKLCKDGSYRAVEYPMSTAREDWNAFVCALACYNWKVKYERKLYT